MASLREIRDHIGSVRSTLKITSAMKLVASAKLRKAQQAAESLRDYSDALGAMLTPVLAAAPGSSAQFREQNRPFQKERKPVAVVVAVASNSSLCGAFNMNAARKALETADALRKEGFAVEVVAVGRKMSEAMRRSGFPQAGDWSPLVGHASFDRTSGLAQSLLDSYAAGQCSRVVLVYNHFVSTGSQKAVAEQWLPFEGEVREESLSERHATPGSDTPKISRFSGAPYSQPFGRDPSPAMGGMSGGAANRIGEALPPDEFILEPSANEILATLLPQVMRLRLHAAVLDSLAAEHAARTVAMQAASDNAEDLLGELTLEYNKGRQQKITAEILDLMGGAQR